MRRIAPVLGLLLGVLFFTPAIAQAHTATISIKCPDPGSSTASVQFNWQNFPRQFNVVNADVTLDTLTVAGSGKASFNGTSGSKTIPVQVPADGQPHTISAVTTWQQDNGGRAVKTATCTVPVPPQPPTPPTPPTPVPPTPVPPTPVPPVPGPNCELGTKCCPVCVSNRKIKITLASRLRTSARAASVVRYSRVRSATMTWHYGDFSTTFKRNGQGRLVGTADFSLADDVPGPRTGTLSVIGQVWTLTIRAKLASGKTVRITRQYRLCMRADGDLNIPSDQRRD